MTSSIGGLSPVLGLVSLTVIATVLGTATARADQSIDTGRELVGAVCTSCHGLAPIETTRNGPVGWRDTVFDMVDAGAQITSQSELNTIVTYLSSTYGPSAGQMHTGLLPENSAVKGNGKTANDYAALLPPGKGAALVKGYCSICHDLGRVVATRRSDEAWARYTHDMLARTGAPVSKEVSATIVSYLASTLGTTEHKPQRRNKARPL